MTNAEDLVPTTVACTLCSAINPVSAMKCSQCSLPLQSSTLALTRFSRKTWQIVLCTVLTFGLYYILFVFRGWQLVNMTQAPSEKRHWPLAQAIGSGVLYVQFYVINRLATRINLLAYQGGNADYSVVITTICFVCASVTITLSSTLRVPEITIVVLQVCMLGTLIPMQKNINAYCEQKEPGCTGRSTFSAVDWIWMVIGVPLTLLIIRSLLAR